MATIYIDNEPYTVEDEGKNLLEVCLSLGFNLPYFCWHPAMHSVGACRQCAVKQFKDEADTRGRIVMACMTPAKDGTRISIDDPEAVGFRASVIEWLMVNHPHDCPVCDEGGECHLQDMTVMTGHVYRRQRFAKRTYNSQNLGPFVAHEMNRCIQCYRCRRFYRDYAGGRDFDVFSWHDHVYFGRAADGPLESEFSGNLVEVCPTGVFTDKTLSRHYTRKWDLQTAPSICVHCSAGCNTIPGERYGTLRRILNRFNSAVNGYFLCDRGRYGYEFVNSEKRHTRPLLRGADGTLQPVTKAEALAKVAELLRDGRVIGIGSPRASLEANFALQRLVGDGKFYHGVAEAEYSLVGEMREILQRGPSRTPEQQAVANADAVFILGEDVSNTAPMLAFALRQAALTVPRAEAEKLGVPAFDDQAVRQNIMGKRSPFFIAATQETRLDSEATDIYRGAPDDLARLGYAVAHAIDTRAPAVSGLPVAIQQLADKIAAVLRGAERPVILSGAACGSMAVIHAAANVARALCRVDVPAQLSYTMPACNSLGLSMMDGGHLHAALNALEQGTTDTVIVLEHDLGHHAEAGMLEALFAHAKHVIALDHLENAVTMQAEVVLPAATFAEANGTFVNHEGRAQRFCQVFAPEDNIQPSWRWLGEMLAVSGQTQASPWPNLDALLAALAQAIPAFAQVPAIAPPADFRLHGEKIPRQPHRYSGRTAMVANHTVFEPAPPEDADTSLAFSMEGYLRQPPAALVTRFWAPGWNSVQALNKYQEEVGGPLRGGPAGLRLIEPAGEGTYENRVPAAFVPRKREWLLLAASHVFGSDELSMHSPGIAELAPAPYLALHPKDAQRLHAAEGQLLTVAIAGQTYRLPVTLANIVEGTALLPVGLPDLPGLCLPAWGTISGGSAA